MLSDLGPCGCVLNQSDGLNFLERGSEYPVKHLLALGDCVGEVFSESLGLDCVHERIADVVHVEHEVAQAHEIVARGHIICPVVHPRPQLVDHLKKKKRGKK